MHPHRNFVEVPENSNVRKIVKLIAKLYRTETELRDNPDLERTTLLAAICDPGYGKIKAILDKEWLRQLPKSSFGKAITYTLNGSPELNLYLEQGSVEFDKNLVVNAIRPTNFGKKNFLFFGSPNSGQTSATIYSLVETCRKLGINPSESLQHDEQEVGRIREGGLSALSIDEKQLKEMRTSCPEKCVLAWYVRKWTCVFNEWIKRRLNMGKATNFAALVKRVDEGGRPVDHLVERLGSIRISAESLM